MQVHHIEGGTSRKCCPPRLTAATIFTGETDLQAVWSFEQGKAFQTNQKLLSALNSDHRSVLILQLNSDVWPRTARVMIGSQSFI